MDGYRNWYVYEGSPNSACDEQEMSQRVIPVDRRSCGPVVDKFEAGLVACGCGRGAPEGKGERAGGPARARPFGGRRALLVCQRHQLFARHSKRRRQRKKDSVMASCSQRYVGRWTHGGSYTRELWCREELPSLQRSYMICCIDRNRRRRMTVVFVSMCDPCLC